MYKQIEIKIVLMGDSGVGKTSIFQRYTQNQFKEKEDTTLGAAFMTKQIIRNNQNFKFQVWDTAGQEKFRSLAPIYYRDAEAAILVYDITNQSSFDVLQDLIQDLLQNAPKDLKLYFVGNKIDLDQQDLENFVSYDDAVKLASHHQSVVKLTSAKENRGIEELFNTIADDISLTRNKSEHIRFSEINQSRMLQNNKNSQSGGCKC